MFDDGNDLHLMLLTRPSVWQTQELIKGQRGRSPVRVLVPHILSSKGKHALRERQVSKWVVKKSPIT